MSVIATVEDAILAKVTATLPGLLRDVGSLPGSWSIDLLKLLLQKAPAVFVAFSGGDLEKSTLALCNARFDVYCVTKEPTEVIRRRGAGNTIGAYKIIESITPALHNMTIPNVGTLHGKNVTNLFSNVLTELGGTVYALTLTIPRLQFSTVVDLSTLGAFQTFHLESDINRDGHTDFINQFDLPQG
jgi:phage gp37-like protein